MSTFDSTKTRLEELLSDIVAGEIQLPDFQRGWVWDDEHIRSLLISVARVFPVGAIMLLETGGALAHDWRTPEIFSKIPSGDSHVRKTKTEKTDVHR